MGLLKAQRRLRHDDVHAVKELVSRLASGEQPRPWPELARLPEDEALELVELTDEINRGERKPDDRFWKLVAVSAGFPANHFKHRAEEARAAAKAAEREARARRLPFSRRQETNLLLELFGELAVEDLWLDDVIVIVGVLMQLAAGKPLISTSTVEGNGIDATVVVNANIGFVGVADGSNLTLGWRARSKYLAAQGWLHVEARGPIVRLSAGPKIRALFDDVPLGGAS